MCLCMAAVAQWPPVYAQQPGLSRQYHAWGRFNEGSWRRVRVVSQTLDESGHVAGQTTTESTSTLVEVTGSGYAVMVEAEVNVAGKRFSSPSQIVRRGYYGQPQGQKPRARRIGEGRVHIRGQDIPSEIQQLVFAADGVQQVVTLHYSDCISPHVLQCEATVTDPSGNTPTSTTQSKTVAVDVPQKVLTDTKQTSHVETVHRGPAGMIETFEVQCAEVPGGVVQHISQEFDPSGRLVRVNTLQLLAYGTVDSRVVNSRSPRWRLGRRARR